MEMHSYGVFLHQKAYIEEILYLAAMTDCLSDAYASAPAYRGD